mmetsp:Transcript_34313/g.80256  ORF Transcript_34313/g.80256 Transcript_34313/m.80256 type:complete len:694 (+) Transcript_34313:176-2257(+)
MGNRMIERTCWQHDLGPQCDENMACINVDTTDFQGEGAMDEFSMRAPKGAIFEETLIGLSGRDRELLRFCTGANLPAVRWLFLLGGNLHASDLNGTTCLLSAVRTGTIPIIEFLLQRGVDINCADNFGWTPLHVSIHMCRRDVVLLLLRMKASLVARDITGQTPLDVCSDPYTHKALQACMRHRQQKPNEPWTMSLERSASGVSQASLSQEPLRYEPNFVPRRPAMFDPDSREDLIMLGRAIFNQSPGAGLAFLVASGSVGSYPVEISRFLRQNKVDLAKLGLFLSQPISLTQQLRAEFINSLSLQNTDVLEALRMAFTIMTIPSDLQKVDQLVRSVAAIWWRQHERMNDGRSNLNKERKDEDASLSGLQLMQYLGSAHCLYQLMFSTLMLHCQVHVPHDLGAEHLRLTPKGWLDINKGIETQNGDVPEHVLLNIFNAVLSLKAPIPDILMFRNHVEVVEDRPLMPSLVTISGWAELRCPKGFRGPALAVGSQFSEVLADVTHEYEKDPGYVTANPMIFAKPILGFDREPLHANGPPAKSQSYLDKLITKDGDDEIGSAAEVLNALNWATTTQGQVWLSISGPMLLISTSQSKVPFGAIHLPKVEVTKTDEQAQRLTIGVRQKAPHIKAFVVDDGKYGPETDPRDITLILLLPDGRWQEIGIPTMTITIKEQCDFHDWDYFCRHPKEGAGYSV